MGTAITQSRVTELYLAYFGCGHYAQETPAAISSGLGRQDRRLRTQQNARDIRVEQGRHEARSRELAKRAAGANLGRNLQSMRNSYTLPSN